MKEITIGHLSHGIAETGGYLHEQQLMKTLAGYLSGDGHKTRMITQRIKRSFKGPGHFTLLWWSFMHARYDINIVVARCALSAILRNLFTGKKVIVVLHYFDERDRKGPALNLYYKCLFRLLRVLPVRNVSICAVAPFWVNYFEEKIHKNIPVYLFPNLFNNVDYQQYRTDAKQKQVHLGQYSDKNDPAIFSLAERLAKAGYRCYFTTLFEHEQSTGRDIEIRFVPYQQYLSDMASCMYTLAYISINEGWNRIAHESLLVGTPVIGVNRGGLGNLLTQSNSLIASNSNEFYEAITEQRKTTIHPQFIDAYDLRNGDQWITPLAVFCKTK